MFFHMEMTVVSNEYLDGLIKSKSKVKILGWATLLLAISLIGIPFSIVTGILYLLQRKKFRKALYATEITYFVQMRRSFVQGLMRSERLIAEWNAKHNELRYKLSCLEMKWGSPLYFKADAILCELHLESDSAPRGSIEGATALYADNTATQIVATGAVSNTSYSHGDDYPGQVGYNRIESSSTSTTYKLTPVTSGSASVQISGPKLIPGVLLFQNSSDAQTFTNTFNAAARSTKEALKNLPNNIAATKTAIKQHEIVGESDFGSADLLASLDILPTEVISWIVSTADSQVKTAKFKEEIWNQVEKRVSGS